MPVGVVFPGAGHAGRQRPGHHRTRAGLRPVADVRAVRYAGKLHRKVGIAPGVAVHRRDEHAISKLPATSSPPVTFSTCPGQSVGQLVVACIRVWPFR